MDNEKERDLGPWAGLQNAFAAVGGSCSAARAAIQSLRNQVRHLPAAPRDPPDVIEFRIRIDALARDFANAVARLQPASPVDANRPALQGFAVYVTNKFRNFARQLDARF